MLFLNEINNLDEENEEMNELLKKLKKVLMDTLKKKEDQMKLTRIFSHDEFYDSDGKIMKNLIKVAQSMEEDAAAAAKREGVEEELEETKEALETVRTELNEVNLLKL